MSYFPKYRAWDGRRMVMVQSLCWNQGGSLWYGSGNQFGWAWVNPLYQGWTSDNPQPNLADICPIMVWTGHKDICGVDIYEDDVVSWCDGEEILAIQHCKEYARYGGLVCVQDDEETENDSFRWFGDRGMPDELKVIGNVHQNPELLNT